MAEIVNLNKFRKERDRRLARQRAAENRAKFSMSKAKRDRHRQEAEKAGQDLDGKRLE
jgi:hypothetical protein